MPPLETINAKKVTLQEVYACTRFDQLIAGPQPQFDETLVQQCDALYAAHVAPGTGGIVPNDAFVMPKWIFLEYLVKRRNMRVHGSSRHIAGFEPRSSNDNIVDGHRPRVYAASSGIMATFYAILDRAALTQHGYCAMNVLYAPFRDGGGNTREGFQFAIDYRCLPHFPFAPGFVHVLARDSFAADYMEMQWYSEVAVAPRVVITMEPADFPLLHEVRGIDWDVLAAKYSGKLDGLPWLDDTQLYPART